MNRLCMSLTVILTVAICFLSCKKSSESTTLAANAVEEKLIGKWKLVDKVDSMYIGTDQATVDVYRDMDQTFYYEFSSNVAPDMGFEKNLKKAFDGGASLLPMAANPGLYEGEAFWRYDETKKKIFITEAEFDLHYANGQELIIKYRMPELKMVITWQFLKM